MWVDKYAAGRNRVWHPSQRMIALVAHEVAVAHQEIEEAWVRCVAQQVKLIEQYAADRERGRHKLWTKEPKCDWVDSFYEQRLVELHEYYANVRVVELPEGTKRFVLVYGDQDNALVTSGTGPFLSKEEAWMWFLNGGR